LSDEELAQAVHWEAAERFGVEHDALQTDFIRTGATAQGREQREEVLIIAARTAEIHRWVEPMLAAGLRPVAIDTHFGALARVFSRSLRRTTDRETVHAVIEIGRTGSVMLILRGDQVAFCKMPEIGGQRLDEAVSSRLQIDLRAAADLRIARMRAGSLGVLDADARATDRAVYHAVRPLLEELIDEFTLCLRYYGVTFRGRPPGRVIIAGGESREPHLDELIEQRCRITVTRDDDLDTLASISDQVRAPRGDGRPDETWAVAAGLGLRGVGRRSADDGETEQAGRDAA
jgi:type IV pilus assembly protein PilM